MTAEQRNHIRAERDRLLRESLFVSYFDERDGVVRTRRGATGKRTSTEFVSMGPEEGIPSPGHVIQAVFPKGQHVFSAIKAEHGTVA
jgi:hypothetical protein